MFNKIIFGLLLLLCSILKLYGQSDLRFKNYYIEDGLPDIRASVIYQDRIGWIWIGTAGGLVRFDGISFKSYLTGNSIENEPPSQVSDLWEDIDSMLWIISQNSGIFRYNRSMDLFENFRNNDTCHNCISSNRANSIAGDSSGILWIGTSRGLNRFDPTTRNFQWIMRNKDLPSVISSDTIYKVFIDRDNRLWLGTSKGLDYIDLKSGVIKITNFELRAKENSFQAINDNIMDINQDNRGNIFVATYSNGLFVIDSFLNSSKNILVDPGYKRSYLVRSVLPDQNGELWLGTRGGIYFLDQNQKVIAHYSNSLEDESSLGHNSVQDIFKDRTGDIWVATRSGLSYVNLKGMAFKYYNAFANNSKYLNHREVYSICQSKDERIWIGTEAGGVNIYDKNSERFTYLTHDEKNINTIPCNCIKAIIQDRRGGFWIGTFLEGLAYYNEKQKHFTRFVHNPQDENSLSNNNVWAIHEDSQGNIWIGTEKGVDRYDPAKKQFHHFQIGSQDQAIHVIYEDKAGNLFFGSSAGSLSVMKPNSELILYEIGARVIFEDSQDRIWIGSEGHAGLIHFNIHKGIIKTYKITDGLPSNQIFGILEDDSSKLWLSTGLGLARFDPEKVTFKTFKAEDGIQGDKFYYGAYCKTSSGDLLFGGQNGLTWFNPNQLSDNGYIPPVVFTDFRIFNKKVPIGVEFEGSIILDKSINESKEIVLSYKHSVLTLDYVALNYLNSSENKYAYMLEGFEDDWNYVGSTRSATYTNLDPGNYIFRVKGSNNNNIWNEQGTSIKIAVTPPFWKTLAFMILVMAFISLIIYLIIIFFIKREKLKNQLLVERVKSKELHKMDMMKLQFFTNISHEIRTPVSLIVSPLARIKNSLMSREKIMEDIEIVYRNALRLGKLVDQLLDYRKLEAGKLKLELSRGNIVSFLNTVVELFKEMSTDKKVDLRFYSALDQVQIYFDADKIEKVMFNLLSNSFKYTPEGGSINVTVSLTYQMNQDLEDDNPFGSGEYVQIVVRDTGSGIEEGKKEQIFNRFYQAKPSDMTKVRGTGIGLSLSHELMKIHHGRILVKSQVGVGTEITVLFPVIKNDPNIPVQSDFESEVDQQLIHDVKVTNKSSIEQHDFGTKNVLLVVEDNKELLDFIKSIFQDEYIVILSEDGEAGLEQARETIPDLVICDIMMPKLDGIKLCKKLKNDFRTSHIPLILLTALGSNQNKKEGILGGADEYITKPFDPSLLKIRVDHLLTTRRQLREKYIRDYLMEPKSISNETNTPDEKFLTKLVSIIEENIDDPEFGTAKISKEVGVSRTQLYRKIAALTDMTLKEFVRNVRLKKAAQLLVQDDARVAEVAYAVGFLQVSYFRKCFKEMYGMTPSGYTKNKVEINN